MTTRTIQQRRDTARLAYDASMRIYDEMEGLPTRSDLHNSVTSDDVEKSLRRENNRLLLLIQSHHCTDADARSYLMRLAEELLELVEPVKQVIPEQKYIELCALAQKMHHGQDFAADPDEEDEETLAFLRAGDAL